MEHAKQDDVNGVVDRCVRTQRVQEGGESTSGAKRCHSGAATAGSWARNPVSKAWLPRLVAPRPTPLPVDTLPAAITSPRQAECRQRLAIGHSRLRDGRADV